MAWQKKIGRSSLCLGFVALLAALLAIPYTIVMAQSVASEYDVLFTLPVEPGSVSYSEQRNEELQWGPTALTVAPDGTFIIANTVDNNLLHVSDAGTILQTIDLSHIATGITDLEATSAGIFALDAAAMVPQVLHLTYDGTVVAAHAIPDDLSELLTGLVIDADGQVLLEQRAQLTYQFLDARGERVEPEPDELEVQGQRITITTESTNATPPSHGRINIGSQEIDVSVANNLAGLRLLGRPGPTDFIVAVSELVQDERGTLQIDQVLRRYDVSGQLLGMARFPLADQHIHVDQPFALDDDGEVYALLTRPESVAVVRLTFVNDLPAVLPVVQDIIPTSDTITENTEGTMSCSISRGTIAANAWSYRDNSKFLNATATDGYCAGRIKPRYIGGAGNYGSVAYAWGQWDTVAGYNWYIDNGYQAGNINTSQPSCARGVDCSGFVTRAWGRSDTKYGTSTIHQISHSIPGHWNTKQGDIMNEFHTHVRLINRIDANGAAIWEATTDSGFDRVIYRSLFVLDELPRL